MFITASRPALSSFRLLPGVLSLKINSPEHQTCHSSSYGVEIICGVIASTFHVLMARCLKMGITFCFYEYILAECIAY